MHVASREEPTRVSRPGLRTSTGTILIARVLYRNVMTTPQAAAGHNGYPIYHYIGTGHNNRLLLQRHKAPAL
eukprot:scaffold3990_cov54-Attheya_sp.AAC.4